MKAPDLTLLTPEEQTDKDVAHMHHSVWAINNAIAECTHSEEEHDIVERNVGHLEHMLSQERISNHASDKSAFHSAIAAGKEHLA